MPEISDVGFRHRGTFGALVAIACGIWGLLLFVEHPALPTIPRDLFLSAAAWTLMVLGGGIRLWSTLYLGGRKNDVVVAEGPYSLCRNPLYLGTFLLLWSAVFFLRSIPLSVGVIAIMLFYRFGTIPAEERYLRQRLGSAYETYCLSVPRLWPKFSNFRTSRHVDVKLRALWLETKRMGAWIWLPIAAEVIRGL